jgi:hypothetical protein
VVLTSFSQKASKLSTKKRVLRTNHRDVLIAEGPENNNETTEVLDTNQNFRRAKALLFY